MMKNDKMLADVLSTLGLKQADIVTYEALLQVSPASIRNIATQAGINRGSVYEALKRLVTYGLASVKQRGQRDYYTAESPEKINELIRDKRRDLLAASEAAKVIIPHLLTKHAPPKGHPSVRYYEDDDGVAAVLKDVLQTCRKLDDRHYYAYSSKRIRQYLYRKFPQFTDKRIAEEIRVQVIAEGEADGPVPFSERKLLSSEASSPEIASYVLIYGDKVALVAIANDLTPYAVVIEDNSVASMQRMLFEQLWARI
jgi:sugar-specific transcriptional regulator TrmB